MNKKPILCLDFDGVCHQYISGWQGADVIPDPPIPGLFDFIYKASDFFEIHIFSSRSNQSGGIDAMRTWFDMYLREWKAGEAHLIDPENIDFPELYFDTEKPSAKVTIDDRAIRFRGVWPNIQSLVDFKPWRIDEVQTMVDR